MAVVVKPDVLLARRKMAVGEFADAICRTPDCQPGDVLRRVPGDE